MDANVTRNDSIAELYAAMRAGDRDARDRFIEINLPLVAKCVRQETGAKRKGKSLGDEMLGAGALALVEGAEALMRAETDDPLAYVAQAIRHAIRDVHANRFIVPVNDRTRERAAAAGEPIASASAERISKNQPLPGSGPLVCADELWEELMACCTSDLERKVIEGFAAGLTADEIGDVVDRVNSQVCRIRERIRKVYESRNDVRLPRKAYPVSLPARDRQEEVVHVLAA